MIVKETVTRKIMKRTISKWAIVVYLLINTSISFGQITTELLIDSLEVYIENNRIPGAMLSIVKADTTIFVGGIGYANIEKNEKVTIQHMFRQGSISKSFTAMGLVKLLKETGHSIHSPIIEIDTSIPFTNNWRNKSPVRVSHLLEHTSGFEDFHLHAMYNSSDSLVPPMINMVKDHRQSLNSRWQPGTRKAYANPNYILVGHLIEKISKIPFDQYVYENILKPLKMESSGYFFKKPKNKLFAQGYQRNGADLHPIPFTTINGSPAGDFCANATDMASYLQHMLRRDTLLFTKRELERIENPKTSIAAKNGLQVGYGLGNYSLWKNGFLFHGHGGQIEGFTARYVYSRAADIGVAVAINRNGNANGLVDKILKLLVDAPNETPQGRIIHHIPDSIKTKFAGFYEFNSPKSKLIAFTDKMLAGLKLDFQDEKIITRTLLGKPKDTLYYAGSHQFYLNNEGVPSAMLLATNAAKPALWINDNYTEKESRSRRLIVFFGLVLSFLLLVSFTLYSMIWFIRNIFTNEKRNPSNHLALFGVTVFISLTFIGFGAVMSDLKSFSGLNFPSGLMYLSSYAIIIMTVISVYRCFKLPEKLWFKSFYILTTVAAMAISWYLWNIGIIGLKMWSY